MNRRKWLKGILAAVFAVFAGRAGHAALGSQQPAVNDHESAVGGPELDGNITIYRYDALGRLTSIIDNAGANVSHFVYHGIHHDYNYRS
jgi:hypothetical protein